jgi:hypothetical protein
VRTTTVVKFALTTASAVVIFGGVAVAQPGFTAPLSSHDTVQRLVFIDQSGPFKNFDVPPKGMSLGDSQVFSDRSVTHNGKNVGFVGGICTDVVVSKKAGVVVSLAQQCQITASLTDGQLTFQGLITFDRKGPTSTPQFAITGGTRKYQSARGQITVTGAPHNRTKITVDLITG